LRRPATVDRAGPLPEQRLPTDVLPQPISDHTPSNTLAPTGAAPECFDLSHRRVRTFTARSANFYDATSFEGTHFAGPMWLTWAHAWDYLLAHKMVCHKFAWFSNFLAEGEVDFDGTDLRWNTKFAHAAFARRVSFQGCVFAVPTDF